MVVQIVVSWWYNSGYKLLKYKHSMVQYITVFGRIEKSKGSLRLVLKTQRSAFFKSSRTVGRTRQQSSLSHQTRWQRYSFKIAFRLWILSFKTIIWLFRVSQVHVYAIREALLVKQRHTMCFKLKEDASQTSVDANDWWH